MLCLYKVAFQNLRIRNGSIVSEFIEYKPRNKEKYVFSLYNNNKKPSSHALPQQVKIKLRFVS